MPNWCENSLYVTGPGADQFYQDCLNKEGEFSLNTLVPMPDDQEENWYNWRLEAWGTKWDVDASFEHITPNEVTGWFNSAWDPPTNWLATVAEQYPHLTFTLEYNEKGCCFAGRFTATGTDVNDEYVEGWEDYKRFCIEELGQDPEYYEEFEEDE